MKVLVAYDGSERSDVALDGLRHAGLGADVEAELVFVSEVWIPPADAYSGPSVWEVAIRDVAAEGRNTVANATRAVGGAAARLRELCPTWKVTATAETGPAALRLVEHAERWPADLLVVGAQGHAVVERLGLGSVALKVLTHLRCSVRVARPFRGSADGPRIAVGVDGSADAEAALAAVIARAWPAGSEATVITVIDHRVLTVPPGFELLPGSPASSASEAVADAAAGRLRAAGLTAASVVLSGNPKSVLVDAARDWSADCIFVGARGLARVERFMLGSVSTSVALHAPCAVEVVHPHAA